MPRNQNERRRQRIYDAKRATGKGEEAMRRVEEAKKIMEETMMKELEVRKQEQLEEAKKREVFIYGFILF